jgi:hypothetical protein
MRTGVQYARPLTGQGHRGRGADRDERRGGEQVERGELTSLRASRIRRRTPPTADRIAAGSLSEAVAEAAMRGSRRALTASSRTPRGLATRCGCECEPGHVAAIRAR